MRYKVIRIIKFRDRFSCQALQFHDNRHETTTQPNPLGFYWVPHDYDTGKALEELKTSISHYTNFCKINEGEVLCTITCPNNVADMITSFIAGRNSYMWESTKKD